jgi:3-phenylpropionate/trans-cinnamate dioxygenase ferredoxin component
VSERSSLAVVLEPESEPSSDLSSRTSTEFQRIASLSELEPHGQFSKWVDDHDILVFRHHSQIKALSNICPHFGGPVGFHKLKDGEFTCLWHNYRFAAESGQCLTNRHMCLRSYKVKVEDGGIWVQLVEDNGGS